MSNIDPANYAVFAGAHVYTGDLGVTAPETPVEAIVGADWTHLGQISEDGIEFSTSPDFNAIRGYNAVVAERYVFVGDEHTVGFSIMQWEPETMIFVHGGGTVTQTAAVVGPPAVAAYATFEPPAVSQDRVNYVALMLELVDGTGALRRIIPKGLVTAGGNWSSNKTDPTVLPVTFSVVPVAGESPWYDLYSLPGMVV